MITLVASNTFFFTLFPQSVDQTLSGEEELLKKLKTALKQFYQREYENISTSPLNPFSRKNFDDMFVELVLLDYINKDKHIDHNEFFRMLEQEDEYFRIALIGEAGVGKTTLLAKVAYEWATGKRLTNIQLLFVLPLRDMKDETYFHNILLNYPFVGFQENIDSVNDVIKKNYKKVMFLLDGLDEYHRDIRQTDPPNFLSELLRRDKFPKSKVVVTTRQWRAEQITGVKIISDKCTQILVKGFNKETAKVYIGKFFKTKQLCFQGLIDLMDGDSLVARIVTPYPIFCCMLCNLWEKNPETDAIQELKTFSQLLVEMIGWLIEQYASKCKRSRKFSEQKEVRTPSGKMF